MSEPGYRLLDSGDRALTVELGRAVDPAINAQVIALDAALRGAGRPGLLETVPTYRSLLVLYDPDLLPRADLAALIAAHWPPPDGATGSLRRWRVPVHYGGAHGADLADLAAGAGLTPEAVIALHAGRDDDHVCRLHNVLRIDAEQSMQARNADVVQPRDIETI